MPSVNPKSFFTSSSLASGEMSASSEGSSLTTGLSAGVCARKQPSAKHPRNKKRSGNFFIFPSPPAALRHGSVRGADSLARMTGSQEVLGLKQAGEENASLQYGESRAGTLVC